MSIKAVIWDAGGVLLRTKDYTPRQRLADRMGTTCQELETLVFDGASSIRAQLGEITYEQHWENIRIALNLNHEDMDSFWKDFWGGDFRDDELMDYIRSLRERYKTGLLSNAFSNMRYYLTQVLNISDAFDEMVISAEVGLIKPDPRIYQLILQRLDVDNQEAVFIDDFLRNVEGARQINMHAIHFRNPQQALSELENHLKES